MAVDSTKSILNRNMIIAIENNQVEEVSILVEKGADANYKTLFGRAPLHIASQNSFEKIVALLLSNNADIEAPDDFGRTPLFIACEFGSLDVVRILLEKGANANVQANNGTSPLHQATIGDDAELVVQCLLAQGALMDVLDGSKSCPLHWACAHGAYNVVRLLLEKGDNYEALDDQCRTPHDVSNYHGHDVISNFIQRFASTQHTRKIDVSIQTDSVIIYSVASTVNSDDLKDLKLKSITLTNDIKKVEKELKMLKSDKLELVNRIIILKPRLKIADNFVSLKSNDETQKVKWLENKERLTTELNEVIAEEQKLIKKIRMLTKKMKTLKSQRVNVYLKIDDLVQDIP